MSLNSIKQSGGNMQGNFVVGSGLLGSGPFSGTVKASGAVQFTVRSSQVAPLWFQGSIQSDGSLSGTYCSLNPAGKCDTSYGGYGNWHVFSVTGSGSSAWKSLFAGNNPCGPCLCVRGRRKRGSRCSAIISAKDRPVYCIRSVGRT